MELLKAFTEDAINSIKGDVDTTIMEDNGESVPPTRVYSLGHFFHCIGFVNVTNDMVKNVG